MPTPTALTYEQIVTLILIHIGVVSVKLYPNSLAGDLLILKERNLLDNNNELTPAAINFIGYMKELSKIT